MRPRPCANCTTTSGTVPPWCASSAGSQRLHRDTDLNNLAAPLQATNLLGKAGPLLRRHLAIVLAFQRDTGHAHPHCDAAINNYAAVLTAMGKTGAEVIALLTAPMQESGSRSAANRHRRCWFGDRL
jgi:hypothetical protein